jgi:hypothetical protein
VWYRLSDTAIGMDSSQYSTWRDTLVSDLWDVQGNYAEKNTLGFSQPISLDTRSSSERVGVIRNTNNFLDTVTVNERYNYPAGDDITRIASEIEEMIKNNPAAFSGYAEPGTVITPGNTDVIFEFNKFEAECSVKLGNGRVISINPFGSGAEFNLGPVKVEAFYKFFGERPLSADRFPVPSEGGSDGMKAGVIMGIDF